MASSLASQTFQRRSSIILCISAAIFQVGGAKFFGFKVIVEPSLMAGPMPSLVPGKVFSAAAGYGLWSASKSPACLFIKVKNSTRASSCS